MRNTLLLLIGLVVLGMGSSAATQRQRKPRLSAQLGTGVARLGESVDLLVIVENAGRAEILEIPEIDGLTLGRPRGPSSRRFTQITNGVVNESFQLSWNIEIRPARVGEFEIAPISVNVKGVVMRTAPMTLKVVRDLRGEDLGFFTITPSSTRVVEGQPFTLELRFGWDVAGQINYANLSLPWWGTLPGAVELEEAELGPTAKRVEGVRVNDRLPVVVEELGEEDGRRVLRLTRSYLPTRSGSIELPRSFLEFARIENRSRGLFGSRQERVASFYVGADALVLEVFPLPTAGQPFDFSGAVGTFGARANADTRDVVVGDSIKLRVDWTGAGNLEFFEPPDPGRLDAFNGFKVFGSTEEKSFARRRVVYDIAPLDEGVTEIPGLPLSVFDPELDAYTKVTTEPIPIRVRPLAGRVTLGGEDENGFERDIRDIDTTALALGAVASEPLIDDGWVLAALIGVPLAWLLARVLVRRGRGDPAAPIERRRRRARRELRRALRRSSGARPALEAFTAFLAARAREPAGAWIGRDPEDWSEAEGACDGQTRAVAAELVTRLERAVFGGGLSVPSAEILAVADRVGRGE